jgi:hypothetical protein
MKFCITIIIIIYTQYYIQSRSPDTSVGIATGDRLDDQGVESR